jgi:uncharacterized protein
MPVREITEARPVLPASGIGSADRAPYRVRPAIGTTYAGHDPELLEAILPFVDYVEVTPDTLAVRGPDGPQFPADVLAELRAISTDAAIIVHGIGLSIGTASGLSSAYLHLLDTFLEKIDVSWHSEHLGYTTVDGQFLGTMLTLPRTEEALDLLCARVEQLQTRYGLPFLLENVVHLLPDPEGDYSEAAFLNELTGRTGCGLIVDAYNLRCDAHNYGLDVDAFLSELHTDAVREIHVAGGVHRGSLMLDVHSRRIAPETMTVAQAIMDRSAQVAVTLYEVMREAVPVLGSEAIATELAALQEWNAGKR